MSCDPIKPRYDVWPPLSCPIQPGNTKLPVAVGARHARAEERTIGAEVEACVLCGEMLYVGDPMDSYQGSYRCGARDDCKRRKCARDEEMLHEAGTSLAKRRRRR